MYPILIKIGSLTVYSFSFFVLISLVISGFVIWKKAQDEDLDLEKTFDLMFVLLIGAIIFGRLLFALLHFDQFSQNPGLILNTRAVAGFSFWGMVLGGYLSGFLYSKSQKLQFLKHADVFALGFAWVQVFIFVGHLMAGSFYGQLTNWWWGIELNGFGKHQPTQILGIGFSILLLYKISKASSKIHYPGFVIYLYLILNALFLFAVDRLRADSVYLNGISANQILSLVAFFIFTALSYRESQRHISVDLKKFGRFWIILAKSIFYLIRSSRAKKNLWSNFKYWTAKKKFAYQAKVTRKLSNLKGVINVKKSKINS